MYVIILWRNGLKCISDGTARTVNVVMGYLNHANKYFFLMFTSILNVSLFPLCLLCVLIRPKGSKTHGYTPDQDKEPVMCKQLFNSQMY